MADNVITPQLVVSMVRHWLSTPPNGYLGQTYGSDAMALLQRPMSDDSAHRFLAKMLEDIPLLAALPGAVDLEFTRDGTANDRKRLVVRVLGQAITVTGNGTIV